MKPIEWNQDKDELLKRTRGVSFEQITEAITKNGGLIKVIRNSENYPNQKVFIVRMNNYIYCAPFVEDAKKIFLKTIFPSSKLTKLFIK